MRIELLSLLLIISTAVAFEHIPILLTVNDCELVKNKTSVEILGGITSQITQGSGVVVSSKLRVDVFDCLALVRGKLIVDRNGKRGVITQARLVSGYLQEARTVLQRNARAVTQMKIDSLSASKPGNSTASKNRTTLSGGNDVAVKPTIVILNHNARIETQQIKTIRSVDVDENIQPVNDTERFGNVVPLSLPSHLDVISTSPNDGLFSIPTAYGTHSQALIYIVGTGIRTDHYEFSGRATTIYDAFPSLPASCEDHETCIASIAGGRTVGVNPNSLIYGARVLDCEGGGWLSDVVAATYAIGDHCAQYNMQKMAVINYSLGGETSALSDIDAMADAFNTVRRRCGAMIFAAAGNSAKDASSFVPAALTSSSLGKVVSVGACSVAGNWASFSNFGPNVTIIAPGVNIYCASASGTTAYTAVSGTSPATPIATGIASLHAGEMPANFYSQNIVKRAAQVVIEPQTVLYSDAIRLRMFDDAKNGFVKGIPAGTVNRFTFLDHTKALGAGTQYITVPPANNNLNDIVDTPDPPGQYLTSQADKAQPSWIGVGAMVTFLLGVMVMQFLFP